MPRPNRRRRRTAAPGLVLVALILAAGACSRRSEAPGPLVMSPAEHEKWEIALVEMRIEKNETFAESATTPLAADRLTGFEGLNYYFPAPEFRYRVPLERDAVADTVRLEKAKGNEVPYVVVGTVTFRHGEEDFTLTVYTSVGDTTHLWLPFYDATNQTETYPGGRYLDLTLAADGTVDLDFNYAYNPYCDYDHARWNCTLPPPGNTLPFPVTAGEKRFGVES